MLHRKISKDIIVHLQSDRDKIRIFDGNNAKNKTDIGVALQYLSKFHFITNVYCIYVIVGECYNYPPLSHFELMYQLGF